MDTSTKTSIAARARINNALRDGKIKKPAACQGCGKKTGDLEAHHHKGDKVPGAVKWLCTTCHGAAHEGRDKHLKGTSWRQAARDAVGKGEHETETM